MNFTRASPQSRGRFAASARHSRRRCRARVVVRSPVSFGRAASLAAARGAVTGAVAAGEDGAGASSGVPGTGLGGGAGDAAGGGAGAGDPAGAPCAPAARGDSSATASNPTRAVCRRYGPAPNAASNDCMAFLPFEQPQGQAPRSRADAYTTDRASGLYWAAVASCGTSGWLGARWTTGMAGAPSHSVWPGIDSPRITTVSEPSRA
jgi:hypothetical protein